MDNSSTGSETPRTSRLGKLSLVFGALPWLAWCIYVILFAVLIEQPTTSEEVGYALVLGGVTLLMILTLLLSLAGAVLGFLSLRRKDPRPAAAIAGLAMSLVCLAPYCLFAGFLLIGGLQDFNPQDWLRQFIPS